MSKNTRIIIGVLILLVLGFLIYKLYLNKPSNDVNSMATENNAAGTTSSASGKQLFATSPLAQFAHLISTDNLDTNTLKALSGFKIEKTAMPDGSVKIVLDAQKAAYVSQSYTVLPGQKLYFIEKSLGDDVNDSDNYLGDDHGVLVDAQGYILSQQ